MISKIALMYAGIILTTGIAVPNVGQSLPNEKVKVVAVKDLETITVENYDDSYLGTIFYQAVESDQVKRIDRTKARNSSETDAVE